MAGGSCTSLDELPDKARRIVLESRRSVLATVDRRARPHVVPVCWAVKDGSIATPVDDKPKRGHKLQRVLNVERNPNATVLFDRYEDDWKRVGWVMVRGRAAVEAKGWANDELAIRYEQYRETPPTGEVIVVHPERISWWTWD